ncbi:differentially expressed in FDCP 8 homolog A [Eurytemora carolleeae]|uniref:differentially expressed in FDCP 8 homolog A n=1 Tax=Eurytemora carolleeae TaxID=1294199 RepID=UPI000C766C1B|nr:differentially expressed in FDCP 8 homolog A [Eurytemora carolleeae]|eukprot:XP_023335319.1 differentially expressed in FDCP 8 homolog A-like [Eurytemora affinis]
MWKCCVACSTDYLRIFRSYCDECGSAVWPVLQTIYECKTCSHIVHAQCLARLSRKCVGAWLHPLEEEEENLFYNGSILHNICPEISLVEQKYECAECFIKLHPESGHRLCDYTGLWFCTSCHWGYSSPIPARIIHNWDFTPMPVSQAAYHLSILVCSPGLSIVAAELSAVVRQRRSVLEMKKYLMLCRVASANRLLRKLEERQHFVDDDSLYSLQDLLDVELGSLGAWLGQILEQWQDHILSCILCRAKGFVCEVCPEKSEVLFPFTIGTETCQACGAVFHRECFRHLLNCPRCERKRERTMKVEETDKEEIYS